MFIGREATDWYWGTHWICKLNKMNDMGAISFHPHFYNNISMKNAQRVYYF